jgi:3-methyladenine DNA glycosylase Mpg
MYYLLNIVKEEIGNPNAVFIKAVEPINGIILLKVK